MNTQYQKMTQNVHTGSFLTNKKSSGDDAEKRSVRRTINPNCEFNYQNNVNEHKKYSHCEDRRYIEKSESFVNSRNASGLHQNVEQFENEAKTIKELKYNQEVLKNSILKSLSKFGYKDDMLMDYITKIRYQPSDTGAEDEIKQLEEEVKSFETQVSQEEAKLHSLQHQSVTSEAERNDIIRLQSEVEELERKICEQHAEI